MFAFTEKILASFSTVRLLSPVPVTSIKRTAYGTRLPRSWRLRIVRGDWYSAVLYEELRSRWHRDQEWWQGHLFKQHAITATILTKQWTKWTNEAWCIFMFCVAADLFGASYIVSAQHSLSLSLTLKKRTDCWFCLVRVKNLASHIKYIIYDNRCQWDLSQHGYTPTCLNYVHKPFTQIIRKLFIIPVP